MANQYATVLITEAVINNKFSYELEKECLKKIAVLGYVLDFQRITDDVYQVFTTNGKLSFIRAINNRILNKTLSIRSNKAN